MPEEKNCETCRHYHPHYIQWFATQYHLIASGHCGKPRIRLRFASAKACSHYEAFDPIPDSYLR